MENASSYDLSIQEIFEHYGYGPDEYAECCGDGPIEKRFGPSEECRPALGTWYNDGTAIQRLEKLPEALDPKKRIRVIFDYDPDFPNIMIRAWGSVLDRYSNSPSFGLDTPLDKQAK